MAKIENIYKETLNAAGSTVSIDLSYNYDKYVFTGTGALVGNIGISPSGTPYEGMLIKIQWDCTFSAGGAVVTIFSQAINSALYGKAFLLEAYYNGSTWDVQIHPDFAESQIVRGTNIVDSTITGSKIASSTVTLDKLENDANLQQTVLEISFEANEQCNNTIKIPTDFTVNSIYLEVIKALSNTDAGTITPKINGSNITLNTAISIPLSTAINTTSSYTCTAANTGVANDLLSFPASKTTAGGKVRITVFWTKS